MTRGGRAARGACVAAACAAACACDFTRFDAYRRDTPVVVVPQPGGHASSRFGDAVAATGGADGAWLLASGGLGTAVAAIPLARGAALVPPDDADVFCTSSSPCGGARSRAGAGLAGVETWDGAPACALTGAFGDAHQVFVRCLGGAAPRTFAVPAPRGMEESGFGLVLAAPRRRGGEQAGEVFFTAAPMVDPGRVFAARPPAEVTELDAGALTPGAGLGAALAVGSARAAGGAGRELVLVAGAPGARAAVVFQGDPRAGRPMRRVGCVTAGGDAGFGGVVTAGDFDGDGDDDVAAGAAADTASRASRVRVFLYAGRAGGAECDPSAWREAATVGCTAVPGREAECGAGDEFGAALAAADLDGDGRDELLVGAPGATVAGAERAGAVWVFAATGAGGAFAVRAASVLREATPDADASLGAAVSVARVGARDEVVVGAPGVRAAALFLCSGIPGDRPGEGGLDARCR